VSILGFKSPFLILLKKDLSKEKIFPNKSSKIDLVEILSFLKYCPQFEQ
jgi:hypothetical protein